MALIKSRLIKTFAIHPVLTFRWSFFFFLLRFCFSLYFNRCLSFLSLRPVLINGKTDHRVTAVIVSPLSLHPSLVSQRQPSCSSVQRAGRHISPLSVSQYANIFQLIWHSFREKSYLCLSNPKYEYTGWASQLI